MGGGQGGEGRGVSFSFNALFFLVKKKSFFSFSSHLHRLPEVVPSPLPVQDVLVDLPRRQVVLLLQGQVEEALVVAEVEVDLFLFWF